MFSIHGNGNSRILEVDNSSLNSRRFKQIIDGKIVPVKFKRISSNRVVAVVSDIVQVYKLPNHIHLHREIMQASRNLQSLASINTIYENERDNLVLDYSGIVENMLEFDEII